MFYRSAYTPMYNPSNSIVDKSSPRVIILWDSLQLSDQIILECWSNIEIKSCWEQGKFDYRILNDITSCTNHYECDDD